MEEVRSKPKRKKTGGRLKHVPPLKKRLVSMTEAQAKLLRMWGRGDLSAGLRWLVDQAQHVVRKPDAESCLISEQTGGQHP